jgi:hypothetical protein
MPDGTPIPPEGLKCWVWDDDVADRVQSLVVAHRPIASFNYSTPDTAYLHAEPIREPECVALTMDDYSLRAFKLSQNQSVPLTMDDYHGEPVRLAGITEVFWPLSASDRGIVLNEDAGAVRWSRLADVYEYKKDGKWQPMRKVKQ